MKKLTLLVMPVLLGLHANVSAEDLCAGGAPVAVRANPGGSQMAQLFPYACVKSGETRDIWVKVTFEGWVDSADLKKKGGPGSGVVGAIPAQPAAAPIDLISSTFALGNRDIQGNSSRVQLTLKVKNSGTTPVSTWSGLIAAQDSTGKVLFRSRVSDNTHTIAPGATADVSYYWEKGEEPYETLSGYQPTDLKFTLHKVEIGK